MENILFSGNSMENRPLDHGRIVESSGDPPLRKKEMKLMKEMVKL